MKRKNEHDYPSLRKILEKDLGRKVSDKEARRIGKWLLAFYSHLGANK